MPDVWVFRFRDGQTNRKKQIGAVEQLPTKSAAMKACELLRININRGTRSPRIIAELLAHYRQKEMSEESSKSYSTRTAYDVYLRNWIVPVWGARSLSDVRTVAVEDWLRSLPLANGRKAKIRNLMSTLFNHAMRYEWADKNPIRLVRQSAKRERTPDVLTAEEIKSLLSELRGPYYSGHRATSERTAGAEMGRRGLRSRGSSFDPSGRLSARRLIEDGSLTETRSHGRGIVCATAGLERTLPIQSRDGLRLCIR
jgi:hypothetical protein